MTVKVAILDLDGTLIDGAGRPVQGVVEMLARLEQSQIRTVIASNRPGAQARISASGLAPSLILDRGTVRKAKGAPEWVDCACDRLGVSRHEVVWLGDQDHDMHSAVNTKVAYFNAGWSEPTFPYGINVTEPRLFPEILIECFAKPLYWFVDYDALDAAGRSVRVRALTDSWGGGDQQLEVQLRRFLKDRQDFRLGPFNFGEVVAYHLLGSCYGSELAQVTETWTVYPGSSRTAGANASLAPFIKDAARLFRGSYIGDLLTRHVDAVDSGQTRFGGGQVGFLNQINTVHLNDSHRSRIAGKNIVVVDDFETNGYSQECARNLLYQAGAAKVTSISIGKYLMKGQGLSRAILVPKHDYSWDPYSPAIHGDEAFVEDIRRLPPEHEAPKYLRESIGRVVDL